MHIDVTLLIKYELKTSLFVLSVISLYRCIFYFPGSMYVDLNAHYLENKNSIRSF